MIISFFAIIPLLLTRYLKDSLHQNAIQLLMGSLGFFSTIRLIIILAFLVVVWYITAEVLWNGTDLRYGMQLGCGPPGSLILKLIGKCFTEDIFTQDGELTLMKNICWRELHG